MKHFAMGNIINDGRRFSLMLALALCAAFTYAQSRISGTVTDEAGEPMIGVSIIEKGQQRGVNTDIDGNYTIQASPQGELTFSFVGYVSQTVAINGRTHIDVTLKEDNKVLDEVVVVGYGTMKRKDVTGSITTVNAQDLNVGAYTDPGQLLQGKVPGLVVVQNSDPNGGVNSMTLRGASTLNGSTAPLYVVDGIPGVELNLVNPADIESIDVLRDASATAIYGSKAANGVIIITTKRGQEGATNVSYSGYASWDRIANDHEMLSASELRAFAQEVGLNLINDQGADTNWQDEVQRTGFAQNHNLSLSGGNSKTTYNASVSYTTRDGVIKHVGNNLFTARTYVESKVLKDRLTFGLGVNGNVRNEWGVSRGTNGQSVYDAMYYYSPLVPVYNEDGSYYTDSSISRNYNPILMINEDQSKSTMKRLQVTGKFSLKIIEGLLFNGNFSYQTNTTEYKAYDTSLSEILSGRNGQVERSEWTDYTKLMELYGNYDKEFGENRISLMAGYSWEQRDNGEGFGAKGYNYYDDSLKWYNIGMANSWDADPVYTKYLSTVRMISFYGRANYSFASRYMLTATVRRDGASTFGSNNKWATFPSGSVAWRLSEEGFMKGTRGWLSDLKLRVGWGQSGNSEGFDIYTARFYYDASKRFDYTDPDTGVTTSYKQLTAARNVNDDLKWETTTMLNVGLDFAFFNSRLNGTIEYYDKDTKDMIWTYSVSSARYPVGSMVANVGRMSNRGIELSLNAAIVQSRDFNYNVSLNFSHNKNKIKSISDPSAGYNAGIIEEYQPNLKGDSQGYTQRIIEGEPIGTFYMYEWAGYDENGQSVYYTYDKANEDTYGERIVDENGNYVTTTTPEKKDRVIVGNAQPWLTMGWNNTFTWKNFDLNLFFTGVFGQKIFNEPKAYYSYGTFLTLGQNILKEAATVQNYNDLTSSLPSDRWLEDGSYFKLNTVTLGYTFRNCFNGWLKDLRVYVSGNNVFCITGYSGRDPEICLDGLMPGHDSRHDHFPRTRTWLVGAQINF